MESGEKLTLEQVKRSKKLEAAPRRISDFLTKDQRKNIAHQRATRRSKKKFDDIDAYAAEIIARFGYDAYKDWKVGVIPQKKMARMLCAERAREKRHLLSLEGIIIAMTGATIKRQKGEPAPKTPRLAMKMYKEDAKIARGE